MFRTLLLLVLLSLSSAAAAEVLVEPAVPQRGEPLKITLRGTWGDSCVPVIADVFVPRPGLIVITHRRSGNACLTVVTNFTTTAEIRGGLDSGLWHVELRIVEEVVKPLAAFDFTVASAAHPLLSVFPSVGGTSGGLITVMRCPSEPCTGARVFFGSRESTRVETSGPTIRALTPIANAELVDVTVRVGERQWVLPSGFQYVAPEQYEAILLPGFTEQVIPGAFGSQWKIEHGVYNANEVDLHANVDFMHTISLCPFLCPSVPPLAAKRVSRLPTMFSFDRPPNWIVHVRRDVAEHLSFTLRVRDLSRQSQTWGTEIPVVRSHEFTSLVQLVDVPLQERFRQTLRIYALPMKLTCCGPARVRFYSVANGQLLHETTVQLKPAPFAIGGFDFSSPGSPDFPVQPEGAEIDLLSTIPELAGTERVRIEVDTPGRLRRLWALVAVTNNETQHVTLVSPQ